MTILTIILLALITFTTRYFFTHPKLPITLSVKAQKLLSYSAPCVLTAIWAPIIFIQQQTLNMSLTSPYLWGATVAIIAAYYSKNIYLTAGAGGGVFILLLSVL